MKALLILFIIALFTQGNPLLHSWKIDNSRQHAKIYRYQSDINSTTSHTTWAHPTGNGDQTLPSYTGVHEVSYDNNFVYVRSTGMGGHIMGPWWQNSSQSTADNDIFVNWPGQIELIVSFPRLVDLANPAIPASRTETSGGAIGLFVDGVSMYDSRDAFSWDSDSNQDEQPNSAANIEGDGFWERDAYENEGQTFDAAYAHSANEQYHYHANPPALRHSLGDSVDYDEATNTYTEASPQNGEHSPILGWVRDGLPIYGPYGYSDPLDAISTVRRMITGYQLREDLANNGDPRDSYAEWSLRHKGIASLPAGEEGPDVSTTYPRGHYIQDYEYLGDIEKSPGVNYSQGVDFDLDEYNTRYCVTPEFPNGVRAYFVSIESDGTPKYPYNIGRQYYAAPTGSSYINSDDHTGNDFTTPAGLTIYAEGGPESEIDNISIETDSNTDEATITWSAIEGGTYAISSNTDLGAFTELANSIPASFSDDAVSANLVDITALTNNTRKFYRAELESVADYDHNGLQIEVDIQTPSNILFILIDDWGIDSSPIDNPAGADLPSMDNLVALASESVRFENAYVTPRCSPTRMAIMSGRLPSSTGVGAPGSTANNRDASSIMTIAEAMDASNSSYASGIFGKWHLGNGTGANGQGPKADGWDAFYGSVTGNISDYSSWARSDLDENLINQAGSAQNETNYATTVNVDDALNFINTNSNWLCWVAFNAPHTPIHTPPLTLNGLTYTGDTGTNRERYKAMLWALDNEIGRLLDGVDLETTTVILLGDNGTAANFIEDENLFPSTHGKTQIYEGGVRVPFLIRPAGGTFTTVKSELVNGHDLFPTMCELMGISPSSLGQDLDGISLIPILDGTNTVERYSVSETFGGNATSNSGRTIRKGKYKLNIHDNPLDNTDTPVVEFFDLNDGIDEDPNNDLLRSGYSMSNQETNAYNELVQYNDTLNTGQTVQFSLTP